MTDSEYRRLRAEAFEKIKQAKKALKEAQRERRLKLFGRRPVQGPGRESLVEIIPQVKAANPRTRPGAS